MRVTLSNFKFASIRDLLDVQNDVIKLEEKIASTKEVNLPSDDPLRFVTAAQYKSELRSRNQYLRDITDAEEYLDNNQAVISRIKTLLQSTRTLLVQASNDTMSTADMQANAQNLRQALEDIVSAANSEGPDGKAFGGTATDRNPFEVIRDANGDITDVIYRGNSQSITRQISASNSIPINRIGSRFFQVEPETVTSSKTFSYPGQALNAAGIGAGDNTGSFNIQGHSIDFNNTRDSLLDIAARINQAAPEVEAKVTGTLIGTGTVASATTALGATAGSVMINGQTIAVSATDTLTTLVDRINSITAQTGVTATVATVTGGYALQLDGGVNIADTASGSSNVMQNLGVTDGTAAPTNLTSRDALSYQLQLAPREPDQLFAYDEGSARFLFRLGITDGTTDTPTNLVPAQTENRSLFNIFIDAIASLDRGDSAAIREVSLAEWDDALAGMNKQATEVAGLQQTLTSTASAHDDLILQGKSVISSNEDIDIASALTELQRLQLKMQAAIGATTSITFDSLANYI